MNPSFMVRRSCSNTHSASSRQSTPCDIWILIIKWQRWRWGLRSTSACLFSLSFPCMIVYYALQTTLLLGTWSSDRPQAWTPTSSTCGRLTKQKTLMTSSYAARLQTWLASSSPTEWTRGLKSVRFVFNYRFITWLITWIISWPQNQLIYWFIDLLACY